MNDQEKIKLMQRYVEACTESVKAYAVRPFGSASKDRAEGIARKKLLAALLGRTPTDEELKASDYQ